MILLSTALLLGTLSAWKTCPGLHLKGDTSRFNSSSLQFSLCLRQTDATNLDLKPPTPVADLERVSKI